MWNRKSETICAVSTPAGTGGISVIRISGPKSLQITKTISPKLNSKKTINSHEAVFSSIFNQNGEKIDDAVITYFGENKSYTGEHTLEISCHGSPYIAKKVLDALIFSGAKLAEKGEFTFRAFMNNRLDLVQAESVHALIESQSESSLKLALRQLEGKTSQRFQSTCSDLTWCLAHIEASIDFSSEGIEVVDTKVLMTKLNEIKFQLEELAASYRAGRIIRDGVRVALIGEPNVGKSSLLNLLLEEEKAIVTEVPGTTRDVVSQDIHFEGLKFSLSDTAGIRKTTDKVESIGIEKTLKEAGKSDVICFVFDVTTTTADLASSFIEGHLKDAAGIPLVLIFNKLDLASSAAVSKLKEEMSSPMAKFNRWPILFTCANQAESRNVIFKAVAEQARTKDFTSDAMISSVRQLEQTQYAIEMIVRSLKELENNTGSEFVAMYLKESLLSLQKILGIHYDDQIMDRVFKEFCLGK